MSRSPQSFLYGLLFVIIIAIVATVFQWIGLSFETSCVIALILFFIGLIIWFARLIVMARKHKKGYGELAKEVRQLNKDLEELEKDLDSKAK